MTSKKLQNLLLARQKQDLPELVLSQAFPVQRDFILDPRRRKAAFVMRRGGKSFCFGIYLIYTALKYQKVKCLYLAKTRESAENIMGLHIIHDLLIKLDIPHKMTKTKITFENESIIQLAGADASDTQITKYLGSRYKLVCIDEANDINHDLRYWCDDMLGPAMIDNQGTITIGGTASRGIGKYWHAITKPESEITHWSVHRWSGDDNPQMKDLIRTEIAEMIRDQPGIENTPGFKNQYLSEWVIDDDSRVYHNGPNNILKDAQIENSLLNVTREWTYIISFDFGYEDASAFVVGAYRAFDPNLYIVETYKKSKLIIDTIAYVLSSLKEKYKPIIIVGDAQNKTIVESLRRNYDLDLVPADKLGKEAHIANMNSLFQTNRIKVIESKNQALIEEWNMLIWNEKLRVKGEFKELASRDNHASDSCLYLSHWYSQTNNYKPKPPTDPTPQATEAVRRYIHHNDHKDALDYVDDDNSIYSEINRALGIYEE